MAGVVAAGLAACRTSPGEPQRQEVPASTVPSSPEPTPPSPAASNATPANATPASSAPPALSAEAQARLDQELIAAAKANNVALVAELIGQGGNVNAKDAIQDSAFLYAGAEGFNEVLQLTLANHVNNLGWTAMQEAILLNNGGPSQQDIVRQLLDAGADPNVRDPEGRTALENAERLGFMEIAGLIRRR
jgi:ankyrin repeat protein